MKQLNRIFNTTLILIVVSFILNPLQASATTVNKDQSFSNDTYAGDDTYYLNDDSSEQSDYYKESGAPYEADVIVGQKYAEWDNPVIVESMTTDIIVSEDNTYNVTKTVKVYYNTESDHELSLIIPLNNFLTTDSDSVSNVELTSSLEGTGYKTSSDSNGFAIVITDVTEGCTYADYTITYTYISRGDDAQNHDAFMQDLMGFKDTPVCKLNFSVTMPKEYEQKNLYFRNSSAGNVEVFISKEDLTINGYYDRQIDDGSLSIILTVQDGYFNSTSSSKLFKVVLSLLSLLCGLFVIFGFGLAVISYYKFGRSEKPEIISQNKPIKGLSPVDIIVALTGGTTNEDLMLYLLQLANEGYVKIEDTTHKHQKNRNPAIGYKIIKVKDYDGNDRYMKDFMAILFEKSDTIRPSNLSGIIYKKLNKLRLKIQKRGVEDLWDIDKERRKLCGNIGLLIPLLVSLLLSLYNIDAGISIQMFSFLYGPLMSVLIYCGLKRVDKYIKKRNVMRGGVADIMTWIYTIGVTFLILIVTGSLNSNMFIKHSLLMTMAYLAEVILVYASCDMKKRTAKGVQICGRILGFREFLLTANEIDLKRAVLKDEQYVYKTLPFAMALGIASDGWLSQMNGCYIDNPTWYHSSDESEFRLTEFIDDWEIIIKTMLEKPNEQEDEDE